MKTKNWSLILFVVLVTMVGLFLRLRAADLLPIDYDEDDYLKAGQHYAALLKENDWKAISNYDFNLEHPPLMKILYGLSFLSLPSSNEIEEKPTSSPPAVNLPEPHLTTGRITSVILGTLEILFLAILNPLAGLLLAVHTFTIKYTSELMLEGLPALTSILLVITFGKSKGKLNIWLILSALLLGITAASKYLYAVVGLAVVIFWMTLELERGWHEFFKKRVPLIFLWGILAIIFFFIFNPYLWTDTLPHLQESILFNVGYSQSTQVSQINYPWWQHLSYMLMSVPWHSGVFLISFDAVITILSIFGLKRQWHKNRLIVIWLITSLFFLFVWPTKWPQYILVLTAPLCLTAAQGFNVLIIDPLKRLIAKLKTHQKQQNNLDQRASGQLRKAAPWLLPGLISLLVIGFFPLLFQAAMSLTDFHSSAIKDGLTGGIWREIWLGLTGQVAPVPVNEVTNSYGTQVHFAGISLLRALFGGYLSDILAFEFIWTILAVVSQLLLGIGLALLLTKRSIWFKGFWRTIFILPWAIPEFVSALIWSQIFDPRFGTVSLLSATWSQTPGYLQSELVLTWQDLPNRALIVLLISALWYGFPLMFLAASAGLKSISEEVTDAAMLDGVNHWQMFRYITWPLLLPFLIPVIILRAIFAFNQFYLFIVLRPPNSLSTLASISYNIFSYEGQYALSAAINILTVVVLIVFILGFNRWSQAGEGAAYA